MKNISNNKLQVIGNKGDQDKGKKIAKKVNLLNYLNLVYSQCCLEQLKN